MARARKAKNGQGPQLVVEFKPAEAAEVAEAPSVVAPEEVAEVASEDLPTFVDASDIEYVLRSFMAELGVKSAPRTQAAKAIMATETEALERIAQRITAALSQSAAKPKAA